MLNQGKTADSVLRSAIQALKAVYTLHKAGYSHNDIKPQNFLKIDKWDGKEDKIKLKETLEQNQNELEKIKNIADDSEKLENLYQFLTSHDITDPKIEKIKISNDEEVNTKQKAEQIFNIIDTLIKEKIHSNRTQLADFGSITPIPASGTGTYCGISTPKYVSKSDESFLGYTAPKEAIEKRDVMHWG